MNPQRVDVRCPGCGEPGTHRGAMKKPPETLPALIARIERVRDWAKQEQTVVAAKIAALPGTEAQHRIATTLVTEQFEAIEKAMRILLGEDPVVPPPADAGPW